MPYIPAKPSTQLTCVKLRQNGDNPPGCGWSGKFYFDVELPTICPRCQFRPMFGANYGDRLLRESLHDGSSYDHKAFLRARRGLPPIEEPEHVEEVQP